MGSRGLHPQGVRMVWSGNTEAKFGPDLVWSPNHWPGLKQAVSLALVLNLLPLKHMPS